MKNTVTKKDLISIISQEQGIHPTDVKVVIQSFITHITKSLVKGKRVEFRRFGVFGVTRRKQKIGRNPKNASVPVIIPEKNSIKFVPGSYFKSLFEVDSLKEKDKELTK